MKKIAFILALLMVMGLALTSCGSISDIVSKAVNEATSAEESVEESAQESIEESIEESVEESVEESSEEVSEESEEASGKFIPATVDGNVYESEFFGVTAEFTEEFTLLTPEQIKQTTGSAVDLEALENGETYYDLYTTTPAGYNINGIVSKYDGDIEKFLPLIKQQVVDMLTESGLTVKSCEISEFSISGKEVSGLEYVYEYSGVELLCTQFYVQKDGYYACYTLTAFNKNDIDNMMSMFSIK